MAAISNGLGDVPWPENLASVLMFWNGLCNVNVSVTLDLGCVVSGVNAYTWFLFYTYGPLVLVALMFAAGRVPVGGRRLLSPSTSSVGCVVLLFLLYPSICVKTVEILKPCNVVWGADPSDPLAVHRFVAMDMTLDCDTAANTLMRLLAWIMLVVVPIGFPLGS